MENNQNQENKNNNVIFKQKFYYQIFTPKIFLQEADYYSNEELVIGEVVQIPFGKFSLKGIVAKKINISNHDNLKMATSLKLYCGENFVRFLSAFSYENLQNITSIIKLVTDLFPNKPKELIPNHIIKENNVFLNDEQQNAVNIVRNTLDKNVFLLWGTTGSGKTEVFFSLIKDYILKNEQCLILLPEIAITESMVQRFTTYFGFEPVIWHSKAHIKKQSFWSIINGNSLIVIGSRSALLLPYKNLKFIVVDEEHDRTYKQENIPFYNCRDMAVLRGKIENAKILLTSATPSIESYFEVQKGNYELIKIQKRYANRPMPEIIFSEIDNSLFTDEAIKKVQIELDTNGQVLFFLNRRGFAPIVMCNQCGSRQNCPKCTTTLSFHKKKDKLLCHTCLTEFCSNNCVKCGSLGYLIYKGLAVEKLCELVQKKFKGVKPIILSSDTCNTADKIIENIRKIKNEEVNTIIATQIFSKGHDFSGISLVIVMCLDIFGSDFRIAEQTIQNIIQISGRAGRGNRKSYVVLQGYDKKNYLIDLIKNYDYETFLKKELLERKKWNLPPYSKILSIFTRDEKSTYFLKNEVESFCDKVYVFISKDNEFFLILRVLNENFATLSNLLRLYMHKYFVDINPNHLLI